MASGIRDKVAIVGMGCSRFGERWDCGPDAFGEALLDAGIERDRIEAAWLGVFFDEQSTGKSALPLSMALRLPNIPVTRVENLCATGTEALRGAVYAVAAGACDIALAMGVEKLKDTGFGGLPERTKGSFEDLYLPGSTAPGAFAQLAGAYASKYGYKIDDLKRAMAHVSWKSHENGALNPKAHLRNRISIDQVLNAPMRHRHHAGDRPEPRQARRSYRQGHAARPQQWRRDGPQFLGRQLHADHAAGRRPRLSRSRHRQAARTAGPHRSARLLLDHRTCDHGRPGPVRSRQGAAGHTRGPL
jgi:hypothetical protein